MAFGKNFVAQPDCVQRIPWFIPLNRQEVPDDITPELLADLFDLTCKFGLVLPNGHARLLETALGDQTISIAAAMPKGKNGPSLSVTLPPLAAGVSELEDFQTKGVDGLTGEVTWDVRLSVADMRVLIREEDACMAGYGCIDAKNGERYGIFDAVVAPSMALPVDDFFRERGFLLRLPDGVRFEAVINRFRPKGSLVMMKIDQVPHLCRGKDVELIKQQVRIRRIISDKVYRKYGFNVDRDDEGSAPDCLTQFRIQAEIEERLRLAMVRVERRQSKRGG